MRRIFGKARKPDLRGIRAFESRTQVWQAAGLSEQINRGDARRARREAVLLLLVRLHYNIGLAGLTSGAALTTAPTPNAARAT